MMSECKVAGCYTWLDDFEVPDSIEGMCPDHAVEDAVRRGDDEIERLQARVATLEAQLAAQRKIVAADNAYRRCLIELRNARMLDERNDTDRAIMAAVDVDEVSRACRKAREAAELLDKENEDETKSN